MSFKLSPLKKWALYDWANSVFATSIMAAFFPIFFKRHWASDLTINESTQYLALSQSITSLLVAFLSIFVGYIVSRFSIVSRCFKGFVICAVFSTSILALLDKGDWLWALILFSVACLFFSLANMLYDAFLIFIVEKSSRYYASLLAYSLGYAGGGLVFACHAALASFPSFFNISSFSLLIMIVCLSVSVWWIVFSFPIFTVIERLPLKLTHVSFSDFNSVFMNRQCSVFLIAYFFYMDGVWTIIKLAVDYGLSLGFSESTLLTALLITQFIGFPSTYFFSLLIKKKSPLLVLMTLVVCYFMVSLYAVFMNSSIDFYVLAILVGCIQGAVQGISRSYFANLISESSAYISFSVYNLVGKFSAILGPLLVALTQMFMANFYEDSSLVARFGISSISILFLISLFFLLHLRRITEYNVTNTNLER